MNLLVRWARFNAVGALGMGLQLAALFFLNRWIGGRYVVASILAVELAVMHNFAWHRRLTWRDRRGREAWQRQLVRFHLSNGLVSLTGNALLMRLLVHSAHLPLLTSNVLAIAVCSMANFGLANLWAFRPSPQEPVNSAKSRVGRHTLLPCATSPPEKPSGC